MHGFDQVKVWNNIISEWLLLLLTGKRDEVDDVERAVPRPRIYRNLENPLDFYPKHEIYQQFRLDRAGILFIKDLLAEDIKPPLTEATQFLPY